MKLVLWVLLCGFPLWSQALQVTNCFERIDYGYGLYHLRCTHPSFSKIDFCVEIRDPGWSVVEHSDVRGVKIYMARNGISVAAYARQYGTSSFSSSSPTATEVPICFAWNRDEDWYYGWVYAEKEAGEITIKESCVETIANRTLCYRYLEIRDGSEVKQGRIGNISWTFRVFDTYVSLGGGDASQTAIPLDTSGSVTLPDTQFDVGPVAEIANYAFAGCSGVTAIVIPNTVTRIGDYAFAGCRGITSIEIPASVATLGNHAFEGCSQLVQITIRASTIDIGECAFQGCESLARVVLPKGDGENGFTVPAAWSSQFDKFTSRFGQCFPEALLRKSGKYDSQGRAMYVWQDYVAGTDPTDPSSHFKAHLSITNGLPVVTCVPELPPNEKSLREYKVYGCADLFSGDWMDVSGKSDIERSAYKFFKVSVEMK